MAVSAKRFPACRKNDKRQVGDEHDGVELWVNHEKLNPPLALPLSPLGFAMRMQRPRRFRQKTFAPWLGSIRVGPFDGGFSRRKIEVPEIQAGFVSTQSWGNDGKVSGCFTRE